MEEYTKTLQDQKRVAELIKNLAAILGQVQDAGYNIYDLEVRLEMLQEHWKLFQNNDIVLQRQAEALAGRSYFKERVYDIVVQIYYTTKAWLVGTIASLTPVPTPAADQQPHHESHNTSTHHHQQAPLEYIKLSVFSGNQREWDSFKQQLEALVVNDETMLPIIKFRRLLGALSWDALATIQNIKVKAENFDMAWNTLTGKYENKPLRLFIQLQTLEKLPSASKESSSHLSTLLKTVEEAYTNMEDLGLAVEHWSEVFNYFIVSRMASYTRLNWVKHVEVSKLGDFPKYQDLKTFVQKRIKSLDLSFSKNIEKESGSSSESRST